MPISLCRFYTFCLPVRCCHAFDAAGPTTSGMKWMTADEQAIYTVDYSRANADAECRLYTAYVRSVKQTVNSIMFYRNMMNFIPHCLTWSILSDRHATPVYRIFSRVPCACSVVFLGCPEPIQKWGQAEEIAKKLNVVFHARVCSGLPKTNVGPKGAVGSHLSYNIMPTKVKVNWIS